MLGDADLAGEAVDRLGEDGAMSGAASAADCASAAVEQAERDAAVVRDLMKAAMGLPDLPGGGDHAAVFVGVRVTEHDLLLVVPGFEQGLVGVGGPEVSHDCGRVTEVLDGFEERDGLQAGIGGVGTGFRTVAALDADAAEAR